MADNLKNMKVKMVNDYIASLDLREINTNQIAEALKSKLGEKPAIRLNYKSDYVLNEGGTKQKRVEKIESITVLFSVEKEIGGKSVPVPVEETFIVG